MTAPAARPNDLSAYWMPFTANRRFKAAPRQVVAASGMTYATDDGRTLLDGTAGLWCCNAGHARRPIVEAIQRQAAALDYAPAFQMGHPAAFRLAARLAAMMPGTLDRIFFTNSGSESVDTALKIARAYHQLTGEGTRRRLIGRARGYHGVGFGGLSVGGIPANRRPFEALLPEVDHLPHTYDRAHQAWSRGRPVWGGHLADALDQLVQLHDARTIAAVIVEPVAGSTGVLVPPVGYLERLRTLCDRHGILLIFDEVITGFGRLGGATAAEVFGVVPDMITLAKGLTSGTVPMGAVAVRRTLQDAFMATDGQGIELFHGYTYSGHPLACAAAEAALRLYVDEDLFARAATLATPWADAVHALKGRRHVIDLRTIGLVAGIELEPRSGAPGERGFEAYLRCFERGVLIRTTGDIIALSPPLIVSTDQIAQILDTVAAVLDEID